MPEFLYIDIETIGSTDPDVVAEVTASITAPANYKKPETIAEWESSTKPGLVKDAIDKTALNGAYGRIVCIGWAWNDAPVSTEISGDEDWLLWEVFARVQEGKPAGYYPPCVVGHNVAGFDLRYLWQRAFVLGIRLPAWFPRDPKPWAENVHDTMTMWGGRDYISLDALCRALKLPAKGNMSGAEVGKLWNEGHYEAIAAYCAGDVERVRSIHRKMLVAFGEAA